MRPIGVFDSGVGGLTVLAALQRRYPEQSYIYLGDTARLPYGTKSGDTVTRYAVQAARHLVAQDIGTLVVACNTASAQALPALQAEWPDLPVIGVIESGARQAAAKSVTGRIAVLSTEGTARTGAYVSAIHAHRPDAIVTSLPCSLLVALAEEGWHEGDIAEACVRRYIGPLFDHAATSPDTIVLGCTHFPLLTGVIRAIAGNGVTIVDSGDAVATDLHFSLMGEVDPRSGADEGLQSFRSTGVPRRSTENHHPVLLPSGRRDTAPTTYHVTDGPERFAKIARQFLGHSIQLEDIHLVEL